MADELIKTEEKNLGGRPEGDKEEMLRKLEPYLKSGLSIRKSLIEAGINNSTFYKYKSEDEGFRSKIESFQQYLSILLNSSIIKHMHELVRKQSGYVEEDGTRVAPKTLDGKDLAFIQWFALNSNTAKEEYGERKAVTPFDPEAELAKFKDMLDAELENKIKDAPTDVTQVEEQQK